MKLIGKVVSIPVKKVTEGMQVLYDKRIWTVTGINHGTKEKPNYTPICLNGNFGITIDRLKTLVVEYEGNGQEEWVGDDETGEPVWMTQTLQLPLKYSQWQAAIDAGEVDSDKSVQFEKHELLGHNPSGTGQPDHDWNNPYYVAKIIPQRVARFREKYIDNTQKKRMYSREQVKEILYPIWWKAHGSGVKEGSDYAIKVYNEWFEQNVK